MTESKFPFYFSETDEGAFRDAMARFATGVTVISVADSKSKQPLGVTISSFAGLSLKPSLILFCLDEKSTTLHAFKKGVPFAVNILAENQKRFSKFFAGNARHSARAVKNPLHVAKNMPPVLPGSVAVVVCAFEKKMKAGDHFIIVGRVKKIAFNTKHPKPLLHGMRSYWNLGKAKR
jgi:flavin reductase (DIM6/NTAB) family NADH-FMN oxidoreductase RutF